MEKNSTSLTNDPYLNTARLTIKNKQYRNLYIKKKKKESFLKQEVDISSYLFGSNELSLIVFIILFLSIPYTLGLFFVFVFISKFKFHVFMKLNYNFSLFWAIGYEVLASILLLFIIKSALTFNSDS
jgi:hypothetical protein